MDLETKIKEYVNNGEIVYGISIHAVGFELRLKDISLEDIMGNQFFLNGKKISKEFYNKIYNILYPIYEKQGSQNKDRGLY